MPPIEPVRVAVRPSFLVGIAAIGSLMAVWGLVWNHRPAGILGLGLALAGGFGLWACLNRLREDIARRESTLFELNRNLDDQVQARTLRLMQTIEDLESFNRMITHDLHSPLTAIMAALELARLKTDLGNVQELPPLLTLVEGSANRMKELIKGLQELALISGRLPSIQSVDVSHHSELVLRQLQMMQPQRQVHWEIEPGLTVLGDPNLIRIGLENVLGNAWKYSVATVPAHIAVRRGLGPGRVIEIQDNGLGFDMAKVGRLFQPFQRLHSDRGIPGHGIGLSIVKRVMAKHGGEVTAQGAPGQGATFRLEFPNELQWSTAKPPAEGGTPLDPPVVPQPSASSVGLPR